MLVPVLQTASWVAGLSALFAVLAVQGFAKQA